MDNASKALVMAGGVMIAIAIISVAVYFYSSASGYANASAQMLSASQIQSFNRFYTAYNSLEGKIRVIDALNLLNRAIEDELDISYTGSKLKKTSKALHYEPQTAEIYLDTVYFKLTSDNYDPDGKIKSITISDNPL